MITEPLTKVLFSTCLSIFFLLFFENLDCQFKILISCITFFTSYIVLNIYELNEESFFFKSSDNLKIPKKIYLTYFAKDKIPNKVWRNLKLYGKGYEINFFSDNDCVDYLKINFGRKFSNKFKKLKHGAHKADFFRYCILYKEGGIYFDIDLEPKVNFSEIFDHESEKLFYTVITGKAILKKNKNKKISKIKKIFRRLKNKSDFEIFQALIATYPNNPIFKKLIKDFWIMNSPHKNHNITTIKFYYRLQDMIKEKLNEGIFFTKDKIKVILFSEQNKKFQNERPDKYGRFCKIYYKKKHLFNSRYNDYPW